MAARAKAAGRPVRAAALAPGPLRYTRPWGEPALRHPIPRPRACLALQARVRLALLTCLWSHAMYPYTRPPSSSSGTMKYRTPQGKGRAPHTGEAVTSAWAAGA
eukprot:scaffold9306_cov51-Isochrysis_galbana.AAC.1